MLIVVIFDPSCEGMIFDSAGTALQGITGMAEFTQYCFPANDIQVDPTITGEWNISFRTRKSSPVNVCGISKSRQMGCLVLDLRTMSA
jgi:hypothetical protein